MGTSVKKHTSKLQKMIKAYRKIAFWAAVFAWFLASAYYILFWPHPEMASRAVDGRIYLDAARNWLATGSPYTMDTGFRQPAILAIVLSPLALLPEPLDLKVFGMLIAGAVFLGMCFLRRALPGKRQPEELYLLLTVGPLTVLWTQQSAGIIFLLVMLGLWLLVKEKRLWSGLALGVAVGLKIQLLPVLLPLIVLGGFSSIGMSLLGCLGTFLLGTNLHEYAQVLNRTGYKLTFKSLMSGGSMLWNIRYFVLDLLPGSGTGMATDAIGSVPIWLGVLVFCATALGYSVAVYKGWQGSWAAAIVASTLGFSLAPYSYYYDSVLLLPIAMLLSRRHGPLFPFALLWGHSIAHMAWRVWVIPSSSWPTPIPSIAPLLPLLLVATLLWIKPKKDLLEISGDTAEI